MLKQHQVDKLFGALVTAVHMTRAAVAQSPLIGYAVLAGLTVSVVPAVQPIVQPMVESIARSELADSAGTSVRMSLRSVEASLRAMTPETNVSSAPFVLTREQQRVAEYAASKYRVPIEDVKRYVALAFDSAKRQRVDPMLVLAVMAIESNFHPTAQSHVGAQGLMQVHLVAHKQKFDRFGGKHMAMEPSANIEVGVQILKEYLARTSSNELALKQYVGAANHDNDGGYGYKVLSERERLMAAAAGRAVPAVPLKAPEWLLAKWSVKAAGPVEVRDTQREAAANDAVAIEALMRPSAGDMESLRSGEKTMPLVVPPSDDKAKDARADSPIQKVSLTEI